MRKIVSLVLAMGMLVLPVMAAEVASGEVYCFGTGDFSDEDLDRAIEEYNRRNRRFGGV